MSIHKLHIFAKNRDAIATQKGYSFQQLKTIEDWLENRIVAKDEDIYCDYEDDIHALQKSHSKHTFSQIKLYSTNFSFSSEGLTKAIAHFFMLYVKGEFKFDQTQFWFETNAAIARKYKDNNAKVLKDWHDNQENIGQELMTQLNPLVKSILQTYVNETAKELEEKEELSEEIATAKKVFDCLTEEDINAFISCIRWKFDGVDSDTAIDQIVERIGLLIQKLPLPIDEDKSQIYAALLITEVNFRSIQDDPEGRKLNNDLLDKILLSAGAEADKWYAGIFETAKAIKNIESFYPGEFQTAIIGARYCRWNGLDQNHVTTWLELLRKYFEFEATPIVNKRKAIYEYLFLKIIYAFNEQNNESPVVTDIQLIEYYFNHWEERIDHRSIEDDIVLLQLTYGQVARYQLAVDPENLKRWHENIDAYLKSETENEGRIDKKCELLELQGELAGLSELTDPVAAFKASYFYYNQIPALLPQAHTYSLARLYDLLKQKTNLLAGLGVDDGLLDMIDAFMNEIRPYAEQTGLRHKAAHELAERAMLHLKHPDQANYLKALVKLHHAKAQWRVDYTTGGYILALLSISYVYASLKMNFASKYYALSALWATWHSADPALYKRMPQALAQVQHADYVQGAWLSAIEDFNQYLVLKREYDERGFEMDDDKTYHACVFEIAAILHAIPLIHPEMVDFVNETKKRFGFIWAEQMEPAVKELSEKIPSTEKLKGVLSHKLVGQPLGDVGTERRITFDFSKVEFEIIFDNTQQLTSIAEAFASSLQVVLCEMAIDHPEFYETARKISVRVLKGEFDKEYNGNDDWTIGIPAYDGNDQDQVNQHNVYIGSLIFSVLQNLTNWTKAEFQKYYIYELLDKRKLGDKCLQDHCTSVFMAKRLALLILMN
jgi:hypothetical protein